MDKLKVYLETMGCQMNTLDSELAAFLLRQRGLEMTDDPREADVLLYNTCSVRQHAENKVHSHVGQACQRKAGGKRLIIGVLGCMAQRLGAELLKRHAGLDIVCGPSELGRLPELIEAAQRGPQVAVAPSRRKGRQPAGTGTSDVTASASPEELDGQRDPAKTHLPGQAYVRIMRGCDKFCTYCVVPYVRGGEQSRPSQAIVDEVRRLADGGVTQVTLLGQTVNSYHHVAAGRSIGLADLLGQLNGIAGLRRIRFITSYPADFDDRILQAMRDLAKVCEYLHAPAQSGSDRILKAMNRRYSRAQYDELIDRARSTVPGIAIAGDFIVGFPGEGEEDFAASADLIRRSRYKNSYIFKYSPRPDTTAQRLLMDDVPEPVKRRRNNELLGVQEQVSLAENQVLLGQSLEALVEGPSPRSGRQPKPASVAGDVQMVGRTRTDHIVVFDGPPALAGQYVNVQIMAATALTLIGRVTS